MFLFLRVFSFLSFIMLEIDGIIFFIFLDCVGVISNNLDGFLIL